MSKAGPSLAGRKYRRSGHLYLEDSSSGKSSRRWFELVGTFIFYVKSSKDSLEHPQGVIDLEETTIRCNKPHEDTKDRYGFMIYHPRRRVYFLTASSEREREQWLASIRIAIHGPDENRPVLLEYKGQKIFDEEDADAISKANQDVTNHLRAQFLFAKEEAARIANETALAANQLKVLKNYKSCLAQEIKALRAQRMTQQEATNRSLQDLSACEQDFRSRYEQRHHLLLYYRWLLDSLSQTETDVLAAKQSHQRTHQNSNSNSSPHPSRPPSSLSSPSSSYPNAHPSSHSSSPQSPSASSSDPDAEPDLLQLSQLLLNDYIAEIKQQLPYGQDPETRALMTDLLLVNASLRQQINSYSEHIMDLTKQKLERFNNIDAV